MKYVKLVEKEIQKFVAETNISYKKLGLKPDFKLLYKVYYDDDKIAVDGDLYDIFRYGKADYGFGSELYNRIHNMLDKLDVIMENQGGGVYLLYKPL
jgi:hypothetical protein